MDLNEKQLAKLKKAFKGIYEQTLKDINKANRVVSVNITTTIDSTERCTENSVATTFDNGFRVGDIVQFKTWEELKSEFKLVDDNIYINLERGIVDYILFNHKMKHLCGTYAVITGLKDEYVYLSNFTAEGKTNWNYVVQMLKNTRKSK